MQQNSTYVHNINESSTKRPMTITDSVWISDISTHSEIMTFRWVCIVKRLGRGGECV